MELIRAAVILSVMTSVCRGQRSADNQTPSDDVAAGELAAAVQLLLQQVDGGVSLSLEKRGSVIPRCDIGERCAMKHGPRIGRLCDCLRGTACNTFFLRCY
ncbi:cocaine- and amphetamine-regulated transcript 4 [Nelusetta ayraudi]|uniref:cocaine- and amphetamine-regulated transcript 4 n=1 Tax=Nelusetta ayraudi TaxID=303726 RepID=UPI003F700BEE